MVYEKNSYVVLHPLTEVGKERYQDLLTAAADEILFESEHPIQALFAKALELIDWIIG